MAQKRQRLAQCRKAAGYSQERLAEALGVERSTIIRWERGETAPQPWFRPRLARALGISNHALTRLLADPPEPDIPTSVPQPNYKDMAAPHRGDFLKHGVAAAAFPALSFEELRHLGAAMNDARRYLDADVVQYFRRQLDACADDDGAHGRPP